MALKRVSNRRNDALARTDWSEVERLLAAHYARAGFEVDHCGTGNNASRYDGGIDLKLRRGEKFSRDEQFIIVQCKHWNAMKVPHNDVHQLIGLMVNEGATGAILVTSGEFTKAAIEAATKHGHVQLIDGDDLRLMLGPLPEPASPSTSRYVEWMMSDLGQAASGAAKVAGGRLLDAAEDRIRGGSRRSMVSRTMGASAKVLLAKAVLGLLVPIVIVLLFMSWVKQFLQQDLQGGAPSATAPTQVQRPVQQTRAIPAPAVVEYVEATPPPSRQPTPEEVREQQRKAEEAIKVLEATTPELYQGHPGQVRGQ